LPDWGEVHREMKGCKRTGVTLQPLWVEYKEARPEGLQYSQFCELYRLWRGKLDRVLRRWRKARVDGARVHPEPSLVRSRESPEPLG
jgi:transposase